MMKAISFQFYLIYVILNGKLEAFGIKHKLYVSVSNNCNVNSLL